MIIEEWISKLEDWVVEITDAGQKKRKKNENSLRDLWDNIKLTNIRIIGVPGAEREKGPDQKKERAWSKPKESWSSNTYIRQNRLK